MNEINIKHGYSLMVRDARGAIWILGAQISKAGAEFMPPAPGTQYWSQGRNTGAPRGWIFLNYVSPEGGTCQVMHSMYYFAGSILFYYSL